MTTRSTLLGVTIGLLIGGTIVWFHSRTAPAPAAVFAPLPEDHGRLTRVVMHYHPSAGAAVASIYSQFLTAAGPGVEVVWVVDSQADLDELKARLGPAWPAGRCRAVLMGKEISTWSRDRCIVLGSGGDRRSLLIAPARQRTANPLRTNDQETPYRLAGAFGELFTSRGLDIDFDGGDCLVTTRHVLVNPAVIEKNPPGPGARFASPEDLRAYLSHELGHEVIWLGDCPEAAHAPPHHVGMYLTVIGPTALVGDVRLARAIAASQPEVLAALAPAGGEAPADFEADLVSRLDCTADQMRSLGYHVVRVPLLPSATPRAWLSYNNGIVETRLPGGAVETIFYMPTFAAGALDAAAGHAFSDATGCRVVPIDCSTIWPMGGSLHCLVNVVARD